MDSHKKNAYELARSQVNTPINIVGLFWQITHNYRSYFNKVLDLGAGDGRFAKGGHFSSYEGIEIDNTRIPIDNMPFNATVQFNCVFEHKGCGYSACIGNPPYVRHHDLDEKWRNNIADRFSKEIGIEINRKCNLYIYFLFLALLKSTSDGLVSAIVPFEWVSRPSSKPLRDYIMLNKWHVDIYKFIEPIFERVLTTASISIIDKNNHDGQWRYFRINKNCEILQLDQMTGSNRKILPYENRGKLWAMRGMSPGTQKVFTLTEGERIHASLTHEDVIPCVTSLKGIPVYLTNLTSHTFKKYFIESNRKCWLIKSHLETISSRLKDYLDSVPEKKRSTWTCNSRSPWYRFVLFKTPEIIIANGFTSFGPKALVNDIKAHAIGSVGGIYSENNLNWTKLRSFITNISFEKRVVPHANQLKKIEIRQLNYALNIYEKWEKRHG